MNVRRHVCSIIPAVFVGLLAAGCGPDEISEKEARSYVQDWAKRAEESLENQVEVAGANRRFEKMARKAAERLEQRVDRREPPYDAFVRDVYSTVGWGLRFVEDSGLTDRGREVVKVVSRGDRHALPMQHFELDAIEKYRTRVEKLDEEIASVGSYEPSKAERRRARKWLTGKKSSKFELDPDNYSDLVQGLIETGEGDGLEEKMTKLEDLYVDRATAAAKLELLVARNAARYAREMKHFRIRHVFIHEREDDYWRNPNIEEERPDEAKGSFAAGQVWRQAAEVADRMKQPAKILHRRIRETLERVLTEDESRKVLRSLQPGHPQYAKLKRAYDRYRTIVENGGWEEVTETSMYPGSTGETVADLKRRLRVEGYYPDDVEIDETYGDDLESAVEAYQKTHQMRVTGTPHDMFWGSLNKTAEWRKRQIGLNLARWRESNVRHSDPMYVLINIPGSHVEVWENQERKMRFRIVVGNDDSRYDKKKEKVVHPNHTPELSAYIDRVIYNPYWNVTDRIRKTEILPQVRKSVEEKYKAELRSLRRKKRRLKKALAAKEPRAGSRNRKGRRKKGRRKKGRRKKGARKSKRGRRGRLLVAQNPGGSGSNRGANSGSNPAAGESSGDASAEGGASGSSSRDGTGGDGSKTGKEKGKKGASEPSVEIDDLYRMEEVGDKIKKVDRKTVFEVDAIRRLLDTVRRLSAKRSAGSAKRGSGKKKGGQKSGSGGKKASNGEAGNDEKGESEKKSPLARKFPYLDPETGVVDVSTTDPDNIPKWYEENDYEVVYPGEDWEYVREKQGASNALGRVKVIFPNEHSVYLHDTPKTHLFERNIRAYSHGCMRMDKPLEFAEFLLKDQGLFGEIDVDRLLHHKKRVRAEDDPDKKWKRKYEYRPVFLERQIPVHVEYFTVRVDDEGHPHFFADVYDKDREKLKPESGG